MTKELGMFKLTSLYTLLFVVPVLLGLVIVFLLMNADKPMQLKRDRLGCIHIDGKAYCPVAKEP